jgi:hypothetical protein
VSRAARVALIAAVITAAALAFLASTVRRDSFRGDTRDGHLSVSVSRVLAGDGDRVVSYEMRWTGDEAVAVRKLAEAVPVGADVVLGVQTSVTGWYRLGGGWVFRGRPFWGRHPVEVKVVSATSADPDIVSVEVPEHDGLSPGDLRLVARSPGRTLVTLTVQPRDVNGARGPEVTDSFDLRVE